MGSLTRKKRLRPISFGETVRDVVGDVEALLYTLHQSVAEVDVIATAQCRDADRNASKEERPTNLTTY